MRVVRHRGVIAAPRPQVFSIVEDPRQADRLHPDFLRIVVDKAPWLPRPGERTVLSGQHRGATFSLHTELCEYRRDSFLRERQVDGPFASYEHAVHLEDVADPSGGVVTELTEVLVYALRFRLLGVLFDRLSLGRDLQAVLQTRHRRLCTLLES